jgi:hypothetical protein
VEQLVECRWHGVSDKCVRCAVGHHAPVPAYVAILMSHEGCTAVIRTHCSAVRCIAELSCGEDKVLVQR